MQIKLEKNTKKALPKGFVEVVLTETHTERFVRSGKVETLELGIGKFARVTPRTLRTHIRGLVQSAKKYKLHKFALRLEYAQFPKCHVYDESWFWSTVAENLHLAAYEYTRYKSKKPKEEVTEALLITTSTHAKESVARGNVIGTYTNMCRDIANTPGGDMTPQKLGDHTKQLFKGTTVTVRVLDDTAIKKLKMGGLLGVGQGAKDKPRFIVIEYSGVGKNKKGSTAAHKGGTNTNKHNPIVFVGKGITFDTGGLQVKPGMAMYEMHMDMSGGAAVIAAIGAIAKLGIKTHVVGLIPAAENAISDAAIRPGDVLTMMSGTTVDVLHTDAEGRLVLADALHYARRYNPRLVIDVATLTGAAGVAVGQHAHVVMTKDRALEDTLRELGEVSGDYTFPLPLWDEYKQYLKGIHGDITNIPSGDSRYGGTIIGGTFLSHFTKKLKWAHIDMAPRMTTVPSDKLAKGASGEPVRLLIKIAEML